MSEANAEEGLGPFDADHLPHVVDGGLTELGVPRAVTDEQTVEIYKHNARVTADERG